MGRNNRSQVLQGFALRFFEKVELPDRTLANIALTRLGFIKIITDNYTILTSHKVVPHCISPF